MATHTLVPWACSCALVVVPCVVGAQQDPGEPGSDDAETPADPERMERARALFIEGVDLSDREQWAEASARFEAALELHPAPTIRFNLAASYAALGRRLEAAGLVDDVLGDPQTPDDLAVRARELLVELEPHLGSVQIGSAAIDSGSRIALDGETLEADRLGDSIRVEPGSHTVTAFLDEREIARETVEVSAGQNRVVELTPIQPVEEAVVEVAEHEEERRPLVRDWRLWLGVGAGVVVVITAIVVGVTVGGEDEVEPPVQGSMDPGVIYWR